MGKTLPKLFGDKRHYRMKQSQASLEHVYDSPFYGAALVILIA